MTKVDKGVPFPKNRHNKSRWGDILRTMKINDSFKVEDEAVQTVRNSIIYHVKTHAKGKEWLVRRDNHGHYRCWRVK